jgi:hypothetical protein
VSHDQYIYSYTNNNHLPRDLTLVWVLMQNIKKQQNYCLIHSSVPFNPTTLSCEVLLHAITGSPDPWIPYLLQCSIKLTYISSFLCCRATEAHWVQLQMQPPPFPTSQRPGCCHAATNIHPPHRGRFLQPCCCCGTQRYSAVYWANIRLGLLTRQWRTMLCHQLSCADRIWSLYTVIKCSMSSIASVQLSSLNT